MKHYHYCVITTLFVAFFFSCRQNTGPAKSANDSSAKVKSIEKANEKISTVVSKPDSVKIIRLKDGFFIKGNHYNAETGTYQNIQLWQDSLKITTDTTQEYMFNQQLYPIFKKVSSGVYELLLRFDNRPSADLVTLLRIENDRITKKQQIPLFESPPQTINGMKVYTGVWDYGEVWRENEGGKFYTAYNPTLYYKFAVDGVILDTPLTISKNRLVYGKFHGFDYNGGIGYPSDDRGHIIDTADKNVLRKDD